MNASGPKKRKSADANDAPVDPDDIEIPEGTEFVSLILLLFLSTE